MLEKYLIEIENAQSLADLEQVRVGLLGKKGFLSQQLQTLGQLPPEERKTQGQKLNELKNLFASAILLKQNVLQENMVAEKITKDTLDVTLPSKKQLGKKHPLFQTMLEMEAYFTQLGFQSMIGNDIEDEEHNFDALNFLPHHPAKQSIDTFYLTDGNLLRTHTSPVQIRALKQHGLPIRLLSMGRVYRVDLDATHSPMFHQMEGLVVEDGISMEHLKGCLLDFLRWFLRDDKLQIRLRPSYFPFTEPSAEVDIWFNNRWMEVLGCGMVHPHIFKHCGLPYQTGFAFGLGVERLTMLKYGINDLRPFFEGRWQWLQHYGI